MYILDNKKAMHNFYIKKRILPYAILTIFCALVSFVYSLFSHGVSSPYMTYLFLYPLGLGVCMGFVCMRLKQNKPYNFLATHFYHTGVIALILSSLLRGVFEIAGTASIYQSILTFIGALMIICAILCFYLKT